MAAQPVQVALKNFRKDTFVMIEGKSDRERDVFFIVKKGVIRLTKDLGLGDDEGDDREIKAGDFFGLISCMSGHPREAGAYALSDVTLIVVRKDQFGHLIQSNASIAMKILRDFSSDLRYIDEKMTSDSDSTGEGIGQKGVEEQDSESAEFEELYRIGVYYESLKHYNQAVYAYIRYLEYDPGGRYVSDCENRLQKITPFAKDAMNPVNEGEGAKKASWERNFKANTFIFCEHEKGSELYVVQKGQVKITKVLQSKEQVIALLKPGDVFGEMALLNEKPRSASAIANSDVNALVVNKTNFELMVTSQPQLVTKLVTLLSERLWTGYRQLAIALIKHPTIKMLDLLLLQVQKERVKIDRIPYVFNFGMDDLVGMAGLSKEESKGAIGQILQLKSISLIEENKKIKCSNLLELQTEINILKTKEKRELVRQKGKESSK